MLRFSKRSWHYRLQTWFYNSEPPARMSLCPYFWATVLAVVLTSAKCIYLGLLKVSQRAWETFGVLCFVSVLSFIFYDAVSHFGIVAVAVVLGLVGLIIGAVIGVIVLIIMIGPAVKRGVISLISGAEERAEEWKDRHPSRPKRVRKLRPEEIQGSAEWWVKLHADAAAEAEKTRLTEEYQKLKNAKRAAIDAQIAARKAQKEAKRKEYERLHPPKPKRVKVRREPQPSMVWAMLKAKKANVCPFVEFEDE